ncbi:Uma2 family endonuclease [Leptolyngbya sp. BC1307]|uniref:Uma2 family endonuclease n=1 Tax=Leptolyngbya sp. BC1307 TaxID=2029589 RepID=UPI000EFC3FF0|nr:Uma2 family endonuclease [Leptolyngbya sp. BC1307]
MTRLQIKSELTPLTVDISSIMQQTTMTAKQFYAFCQANRDLRIERTAEGEVIVMPPAFSDTGNRNFGIAVQLGIWAAKDGTGEGFDSSAGFTLPNGAVRSPDAAWIKLTRWNTLSETQKASFAPICPDFVIELRSASDSLTSLQKKMAEYTENGALLGLLIDRKQRTVSLYRPNALPQVLEHPDSVSCDPELPEFRLQMSKIW